MSAWVNAGLILVGAGVMLVAFVRALRFAPSLEAVHHQRAWRVLVVLMGFFLVAYLGAVGLVLAGKLSILASVTALIFALGACFVLFTVVLSVTITSELLAATLDLESTVAERTTDLAAARDAAEEANEAKSRFLANINHEIRTPLTGIIGATNLLDTSRLDEQERQLIAVIQRGGHTLHNLVEDVLDFAKIESAEVVLEQMDFDLDDVLEHVRSLLEVEAHSKDLELVVTRHDGIPQRLSGDRDHLHRILLNLLGNAVKFTDRGTVSLEAGHVATTPEGGIQLLFSVADTGIGMSNDTVSRVFEPFTQADGSTTRRFGGTGLGLTITRQLVEQMGGSIEVESETGRGSRFHVSLTFAPAATEDHTEPVAPAATSSQCSLLIVEDDEVSRQIARYHLEALGHTVDTAGSGQEALATLAERRYDAVLMDCQMPGLDGYETTRRLRALEVEHGRRTPVIALTAHAIRGERRQCLDAGMDDFLTKPYRHEDLEATLTRWLPNVGETTETNS